MALAFVDNFNREDGPLGDDWVLDSGTPTIVGERASFGATNFAHCTVDALSADSCQRLTVVTPTSFVKTVYMHFRATLDGANYYRWTFSIGSGSLVATLTRRVSNVTSTIVTTTLGFTWGSSIDLIASVVGSRHYAWCNGWLMCAATEPTITSGGYNQIGSGSAGVLFDDYQFYDLLSSGGTVVVTPGPGDPPAYAIDIYNNGADWTPGAPGQPLFTASTGSIESQEILDTDHALLTYLAPELNLQASLYDPQNDWNYPLELASTLEGVGSGGSGSGLTTQEHEILLKLETEVDQYLLEAVIYEDPWSVLMGAAWWILGHDYTGQTYNFGDMVAAILNSTDGLAVIKNRIDLIRSAQDALTSEETYSLPSVQEAIRGVSSRDLTQVYNLVDALGAPTGGDLTEILAELAAIRTANLWTLGHVMDAIAAIEPGTNGDVLQELAYIRTANQWTLGHIMDAIAGISVPDYSTQLQEIADDVAAIPTDPITDLTPVLDAVAAVRGTGSPDIAAVLTAIGNLPTEQITSLQPVLDAISTLSTALTTQANAILAAIAALEVGTGTPGAPVWPGVANVTFGTPVALAATFASSEACDGVIVSLTSDPNNHGVYGWGAVLQYPRAGYVSFVSDNGDYSDVLPFSFPNNVLSVVGMQHADGFIGRARPGATGTVTPWTVNAP